MPSFFSLFSVFSVVSLSLSSALMAQISPLSVSAHNIIIPTDQVSSEEALFIRRILSFLKDQENGIVKTQIRQFIATYPESEFIDPLQSILGDLYWSEKNFNDALSIYDAISSSNIRQKIFQNRLDCLYHLEKYETLIEEISPHLSSALNDPSSTLLLFYYAEAMRQQAKMNANREESIQEYLWAVDYYKQLFGTAYTIHAKLALTEVYVALGKHQEAVDLYIELATLVPEQRENMIFQAAKVLSAINPLQSIISLREIERHGGMKASEAALNRIMLMFQQKQYAEIIDEKETLQQMAEKLAPDQQFLVKLTIGRAYFALNQFENTLNFLTPLFNASSIFTDQNHKILLLTMITTAHHLNRTSQVEELAFIFESHFNSDPSLAHVLYIKALRDQKADHFQGAEELFNKIAQNYPNFEHLESVYLERSLLFFHQKRWKESRFAFIDFLQKYPNSPQFSLAIRSLPKTTIHQLEEAEHKEEATDQLREQLISDLELALNTPDAVSLDDKPNYLIKIAKAQFDLQRHQAAITTLNKCIQHYSTHPNRYQAHILLAICYQQGLHDTKNAIVHNEKALALNPTFSGSHQIHLTLFSAYLSQAKQLSTTKKIETLNKQKENFLDKAADHLFAVVAAADHQSLESVSPNNLLWLANHLYHKVQGYLEPNAAESIKESKQEETAKHSVLAFQKALSQLTEGFDSEATLTDSAILTQDKMHLESEFLKLSQLYSALNQTEKELKILNFLVNQQELHSDWPWDFRFRVRFSRAYALEIMQQTTAALEAYSSLAAKSTDLFIRNLSQLHFARLSFNSLSAQERTIENPKILFILQSLKDLQIRKLLAHEPIHLEAMIDYAKMRSALEPEEKRNTTFLSLLTRAKEELISENDLCSKDYHANRTLFPAKDRIYNSYLILMDANIAHLRAKIAQQTGLTEEADKQATLAKSLYLSLLNRDLAVSKYVINEAKKH